MDLSYTPEEEEFRARVRAWIGENKPHDDDGSRDPEPLRAWQRRLHGQGYVGAAWQVGHWVGGLSSI